MDITPRRSNRIATKNTDLESVCDTGDQVMEGRISRPITSRIVARLQERRADKSPYSTGLQTEEEQDDEDDDSTGTVTVSDPTMASRGPTAAEEEERVRTSRKSIGDGRRYPSQARSLRSHTSSHSSRSTTANATAIHMLQADLEAAEERTQIKMKKAEAEAETEMQLLEKKLAIRKLLIEAEADESFDEDESICESRTSRHSTRRTREWLTKGQQKKDKETTEEESLKSTPVKRDEIDHVTDLITSHVTERHN